MALVFWFYGLSGSGKTTEADKFAENNKNRFFKIERLDGDTFREFWKNDLGFSRKDRFRNITRAAARANVLSLRGTTVVASFTTPFKVMREHLRTVLGEKLQLIYVDTPLEVCIEKDPKGLYKKALAGEIKNMIGVDMKFEK